MELLDMGLPDTLTRIDEFIWGPPLLVLLVWTGVFLTWNLGLIQVSRLPLALGYVLNSRKLKSKFRETYRALPHSAPHFSQPLGPET